MSYDVGIIDNIFILIHTVCIGTLFYNITTLLIAYIMNSICSYGLYVGTVPKHMIFITNNLKKTIALAVGGY